MPARTYISFNAYLLVNISGSPSRPLLYTRSDNIQLLVNSHTVSHAHAHAHSHARCTAAHTRPSPGSPAPFAPASPPLAPVLSLADNLKHSSLAAYRARALVLATRYARPAARALIAVLVLMLLTLFVTQQITSGAWDPDVRGKTMVIYAMSDTLFTRAQGMFAEFTAAVGALHYGVAHGAAALTVDFRTAFYVDEQRGPNWFAYFFEPTMRLNLPPTARIDSVPEVRYDAWLARFGRLGSFAQVMTKGAGPGTASDAGAATAAPVDPDFVNYPFPVNGAVSLDRMRSLVQTYVKPLPSLTAQVDAVWRDELGLKPGEFVIGLHYRGLDKIDAYPFVPAPPGLFQATVAHVLALYKPAQWRVYLATDTADFVDWAREIWGERLAVRDIARISLKDIKYDVDGTPIPLHKTRSVPAYERAEGAVVDMMLLARTNYLIKNRSSLSDTALAFAPAGTNYTFILGPDDPVYSSDVRVPRHMEHEDPAFMQAHGGGGGAAADNDAKEEQIDALRKVESNWFYRTFWFLFSVA